MTKQKMESCSLCSIPDFEICKDCKIEAGKLDELEEHINSAHYVIENNPQHKCRNCMHVEKRVPRDKLSELLNMCDEGFDTLTDNVFISGYAVAYALTDFMPKPESIDLFFSN